MSDEKFPSSGGLGKLRSFCVERSSDTCSRVRGTDYSRGIMKLIALKDFAMFYSGRFNISSKNAFQWCYATMLPFSPILLDVERPLELQMCLVIVIDEFGDRLVMASTEHA